MAAYEPTNVGNPHQGGYCAIPITLDTYRGCTHGCLYCYERQLDNQHLRQCNAVVPRDRRTLLKELYDDPELKLYEIAYKYPIRVGALSDPFPAVEAKLRETYKTMKLLEGLGIPSYVTTKAPHRVTEEYLEILKATNGAVKVSFSTFDEKKARILEPGVISPQRRIEELRRIRDYGVHTVVRLAPFLYTEEYDYNLLAGAADAVAIEPFRFAVIWRRSFPPQFWEVVSGEKMPEGELNEFGAGVKGGPIYKWAVKKEKEYFSLARGDTTIPYYSEGVHWVLSDPFVLREIYKREYDKAHAVGLKWGVCSLGMGINNIDLTDPPCACIVSDVHCDTHNLVSEWHKNRWADLMPAIVKPIVKEFGFYGLSIAMSRIIYALAGEYRPIAFGDVPRGEIEAPFVIDDERRGNR